MKIINGHALAEKIKDKIVAEILGKDYFLKTEEECSCADHGHDNFVEEHEHNLEMEKKEAERKAKIILNSRRPNLAILLVGSRDDSRLYVDLKEKEAVKVGIDTHVYKCPEETSREEILKIINYLNKDDSIDAILVQLPLPSHLNADEVIKAIDPEKDVDRFHPDNLKILLNTCKHQHVMPPVFEVVLEILKSINFKLQNKKVCILANSQIFGESLAKVLECEGAQVEISGTADKELEEKTTVADVLISALGKPEFIKGEMIKKGSVLIDIGITKKDGKVYGDADFKDVEKKVAHITPVPGGVGPLTIAMTFKNTLELFKKRKK